MKNPIPFGKYLLLDRINVGGMAEVFFAKVFGDTGGERILALKKILPTMVEDEEFISMFIDEARIAVQLDHPNIVQIFELGKQEENYYIAMEYVPGRDLRATLDRAKKRKEPLGIDIAVYIAAELAHGLDYAHRAKDQQGENLHIVHRDVSPQNILISYDGQIKLIDFGIAKAATRNQKTQAGILKGKFGYMSPEQVRGLPIDRRSDLFALGVILYEMLTGERLFVGDSDFSVLERVRNAEVLPPRQLNSSIPEELDRVVVRALAREPEQRYQWASELASDLLAFLGHEGPGQGSDVLGGYIRQSFSEEVLRERERMVRFGAIERPAEVPTTVLRPYQGTRPPAPLPFVDEHTALIVGTVAQTDEWESPDTNPMPSELYPLAADQTGATAITPAASDFAAPPNQGRPPPPQLERVSTKPAEATRIVDSNSAPRPSPPPTRPPAGKQTILVRAQEASRTARIAIALLAVASVIFATMYLRKQSAPKGTLMINVRPSAGLNLEVDGRAVQGVGEGQYLLHGVPVGDHLVVATGPTGERRLKVTVTDSEITNVEVLLQTAPAPEVAPPDAGPPPVEDAGDPSTPTDAKEVVNPMPAIDFKNVAAAPKDPGKEAGSVQVTIDSDPPEAAVSVDDLIVGHAPYVLTAERGRSYFIRADLPGYRAAHRRTRFQETGAIKLTLTPSAPEAQVPKVAPPSSDPAAPAPAPRERRHAGGPSGTLIISSTQTAKVFVDGKSTNRYTPVPPADPLELSSGRHTIRLQTDDGKKAEKAVTIEAHTINKLLGVEVL